MSLTKAIIRIALVVCTVLGSHAAMAGPVRCSVNNQDSTCVGQITTGWQTAPTCPSTPGYTTVAAAQWIGSQYSAPQCNYQAPPSCPAGFNQTSAPSWNGSNWVGLGCAPPPPGGGNPNTPEQQAACIAAMNAMTPMGGPVSTLFMTGPASGQGMDAYNAAVAPLMAMISSGEYIMDFNRTSGTPPASGLNVLFTYQVGGDNLFCWLTPGTTNVISVRYIRDSTSGSGGGAG